MTFVNVSPPKISEAFDNSFVFGKTKKSQGHIITPCRSASGVDTSLRPHDIVCVLLLLY